MSHPPHSNILWLSFTSVSALPDNTSVVIQVSTGKSRRDLSPVLRPAADGLFDSPLRCAIEPSRPPSFVLHLLAADDAVFSPISSFPFNIHIASMVHALSASEIEPIVRNQHDVTDDIKINFEATLIEPADRHSDAMSDAPDEVIAYDLDALDLVDNVANDHVRAQKLAQPFVNRPPVPMKPIPGKVDASFSSVSEDDYPHDASPRVTRRVSFNSRVAEIPTTEKLQRDIDAAARDRAHLWHGVSDIVTQLSTLRREMRALETRLQAASSSIPRDSSSELSLPMSPLTPQHTVLFSSPIPPTPIQTPSTTPRPSPAPTSLPTQGSAHSIKRRRAVLDGDMIAEAYGDRAFVVKGIDLALDYYTKRDIRVVAVVSEKILQSLPDNSDSDTQRRRISYLRQQRLLAICPSHNRISNFLLQYAVDHDAVIVSNAWLGSECTAAAKDGDSQKANSQYLLNPHVTSFMFIAGKFVPEHSNGEIKFANMSSSLQSQHRVKRCGTF